MCLRGEPQLTSPFTLKQLPLSEYFFKCLRSLSSRKMLTVYDTSDLKALPLVFQFVAKITGQRVFERLALCLEIRDRSSITLLVSYLMFRFRFVPTSLSRGVPDEYDEAFRHLALSHRDYLL